MICCGRHSTLIAKSEARIEIEAEIELELEVCSRVLFGAIWLACKSRHVSKTVAFGLFSGANKYDDQNDNLADDLNDQ